MRCGIDQTILWHDVEKISKFFYVANYFYFLSKSQANVSLYKLYKGGFLRWDRISSTYCRIQNVGEESTISSISVLRWSLKLILGSFEVLMSTIDPENFSFKLLLQLSIERDLCFERNISIRQSWSHRRKPSLYTYISGRFLYSRIVCWFCSQCGFAAIICVVTVFFLNLKLKKIKHFNFLRSGS